MEPLLVASGGVAGALLRWKVNKIATNHKLTPYSTIAVNTAGSFILGVATQAVFTGRMGSNSLLLIGTGFCGSFTTFSTFSVDVITLVQKDLFMKAFSLVAMTNVCGITVRTYCN